MPKGKKKHEFSEYTLQMAPLTKKLLEGQIGITYYRQKARETRRKLRKKR